MVAQILGLEYLSLRQVLLSFYSYYVSLVLFFQNNQRHRRKQGKYNFVGGGGGLSEGGVVWVEDGGGKGREGLVFKWRQLSTLTLTNEARLLIKFPFFHIFNYTNSL